LTRSAREAVRLASHPQSSTPVAAPRVFPARSVQEHSGLPDGSVHPEIAARPLPL